MNADSRSSVHPLQSPEWGEFREKTGVKVICRKYLGKQPLVFQLTIHRIPYTPFSIGYLPKGPLLNKEILEELTKTGKENKCIFIKIEPNVLVGDYKPSEGMERFKIVQSPRPLFAKHTFLIDLTLSESELLKNMKEKTRYNLRLAEKKGVFVREETSDEAFEIYLKLLKETLKRNKFFSHDEKYHRLMWQILKPAGIARLLIAYYQPKSSQPISLVAWLLFVYDKILYYPYGASSSQYRHLMASSLMMWEAISFGKKLGCHTFDLWGALGPNPDSLDPWYGFHRFKEGYGGKLVEFIESSDLVLNPLWYKIYNLLDRLRWLFLSFTARLHRSF